jgi:hypothetical protein
MGCGQRAKWLAALSQGYPAKANLAKINWVMAEVILTIMVIYVTMVGPIAAFLVEMFPTKIRYTSMSLPYHIGNGWFGSVLPLVATALVAAYGDIYAGLWYPIIVAVMTFVIGSLLLVETKDVDIVEGSGVEAQLSPNTGVRKLRPEDSGVCGVDNGPTSGGGGAASHRFASPSETLGSRGLEPLGEAPQNAEDIGGQSPARAWSLRGLEVAKKRAPGASKRSGGRSRSYSRYARSLLSLRDEQITEIGLMRSAKVGPSPFLNKAETLLTRYWAGATWQAREEIQA